MEDFRRPNFRSSDRRLEIVSGKGFGSNQLYTNTEMTTYRPPPPQDLPPVAARASQVAAKPWGFNDSEMKRKKRIAKYKVYTVEGRMKASIRSGFRWLKNKCSVIIHGY